MANLPEKIITTVDKITEIPSNAQLFINANGEFRQANVDDVISASSVINEKVNNQFKVSTGSPLVLKTSKGNAIDFSADGRSEQDGTPTPDTPIEIKSVGDKGWFDGELLQGYYDATTGNFTTQSTYVCSKNFIPCKEGDIVNLIYEVEAFRMGMVFYDADLNIISGDAVTAISNEWTAPVNSAYFVFNIRETQGENTTIANAKKIVVTINGMYALIVKEGNKNLWEFGDQTFTRNKPINVNLSAGTYTFSATVTSSGTDGTYSRVVFYDKDSTQLGYVDLNRGTRNGASITFDTDIATISLYAEGSYSQSEGDTATFADIQLEVGSTMTDYQPHQEQTTYIPLTQPLRQNDKIVCQDGVYGVYRTRQKHIYDGSSDETWNVNNTNGRFTVPKTSNMVAYDESILCSHFVYGTSGNNTVYIGSSRLSVAYEELTTLEEWLAWLAENPITVEYNLATPIFEPFADQTPFYEMQTFDEVTYITNADDANMEVEYPTSKTAGIASIGFAKGNLADIKIEQLSAQLLEVQTALLNV